jgi:hypothetical protein
MEMLVSPLIPLGQKSCITTPTIVQGCNAMNYLSLNAGYREFQIICNFDVFLVLKTDYVGPSTVGTLLCLDLDLSVRPQFLDLFSSLSGHSPLDSLVGAKINLFPLVILLCDFILAVS